MAIWFPSYSNAASRRYPRTAKKEQVKLVAHPAENVWAAAAAANRQNGGYFKDARWNETDDITLPSNKVMVNEMLTKGEGWTEADVAVGCVAREYWQQGGIIKIMSGAANDFETTAINLAQKDSIESFYDIAVISSLIAAAERGAKRDELNQIKNTTNSQHQGKVGDAVLLNNAEILVSRYVDSVGKYRNEARHEGNLYAWWGRNHKIGNWVNVGGKVKAHIVDRDTGAKVTQLNYTKVED